MSGCPICEHDDIEVAYTNERITEEYWDEESERVDWLGLKRELEAEFGFTLSLTKLKEHDGEHITYSFGGFGGGIEEEDLR